MHSTTPCTVICMPSMAIKAMITGRYILSTPQGSHVRVPHTIVMKAGTVPQDAHN